MICRIKKYFEIQPATYTEVKPLFHYHYINTPPPMPKYIFKITPRAKHQKSFPDIIAMIVYSSPIANIRGRNIATNNFFLNPGHRSCNLSLLNKKILYVSRIIVDPRFRRQGLGTWLQAETLSLIPKITVETLAPIDFTNRILLHCGFKVYYTPPPERYKRFCDNLSSFGFSGDILKHPDIMQKRVNALSPRRKMFFIAKMKSFLHGFGAKDDHARNPDIMPFIINRLFYPRAYFIKRDDTHYTAPTNSLVTVNSVQIQ